MSRSALAIGMVRHEAHPAHGPVRRDDVVERTDKDAATGTTIWFRSHRRLYIIDTPTEHRVEAYAP